MENTVFRAVMIAALMSLTNAAAAQVTTAQALTSPHEVVEAELAKSHPSSLYSYAARLFEEGRAQEAVVWFYVGQLRYRYLLAADPSLAPDGEPALMASLNATIGQTINEWAGGDPAAWARAIGSALAWDELHENAITPKGQAVAEQKVVRDGLARLQEMVLNDAEEIRAQRKAAGLEVR
jgi:hypothetical protein